MFEQVFTYRAHINRHSSGPYAAERERYLTFIAAEGRSSSVIFEIAQLLYSMADWLPLGQKSIAPSQIQIIATRWSATRRRSEKCRHRAETWFVFHATRWMRLLGRLEEPVPHRPFAAELQEFLQSEGSERGLAARTLERENKCLTEYLSWAAREVKALHEITAENVSRYLSTVAVNRGWKRTTISVHVGSLRNFFRFAQANGWCISGLADTIDAPRIYRLEGLARGPQWNDVQQLLEKCAGSDPTDIRDYAMLLLATVYGFRSGEVRLLRLEDIDWQRKTVRVHRTKQRKMQDYPLTPTVGEAILRYLQQSRPRCSRREVFVTRYQPFRPLTASGFTLMVRRRLLEMGLELSSYGPHALRHSCATQLLAEGCSLKEISDHLGHRSLAATQIYAKVDLTALREVAGVTLPDFTSFSAQQPAGLGSTDFGGDALRTVAAVNLGGLL